MRSAYDEILLLHNTHPLHRGELAGAIKKELVNASCGDKLTVFLKLKNGKIMDAKWDGQGCAISLASADLMAEAVIGKKVDEAQKLLEVLPELLMGKLKNTEEFGEAAALSTVARMPARQACAKLAWQALAE